MNGNVFTFIVIPIIVLSTQAIAQKIRKKIAKPTYQNNVQTPGKLDQLISKIIMVITIFSAIMTLSGAIIGETEMAIVFLILTLVFWGILALLKREYDMSYQENEEFFILNAKGKEYKVYYENIIDWVPSLNEIQLLDKTKENGKYIRVNISMLHPQILLQKIVEMTSEGKFQNVNNIDPEDPMRENELIHFLESYNYGYLVEDYVRQ